MRAATQPVPAVLSSAWVAVLTTQPAHFPQVFGPRGDQPLDIEVVRQKFAELSRSVQGGRMAGEEIAAGFVRIAVDNMANAIKKISIQRGFDVQGMGKTTSARRPPHPPPHHSQTNTT